MRRLTISTLVISALLSATAVTAGSPDQFLSRIKLLPGFEITYFSDDIPDARSLALGGSGTVFVGNLSGDKVYALVDSDGDGMAERRFIIAEHLDTPNGIAFYNGALYVAEHHRIIRFNDIEKHLSGPPKPEVIYALFQ